MIALSTKGVLAEWLGNGLQNHVQRFESARHLQKTLIERLRFFYLKIYVTIILFYGYIVDEALTGFNFYDE